MFNWEVVIRRGREERLYKEDCKTRYSAGMSALAKFIEEFELLGKPYEYWYGNDRSGAVEISIRCSEDGRKVKGLKDLG